MNVWIFVIGYASIQSFLLIYLLITSTSKNRVGVYYLIFLLLVTTYLGLQFMLIQLGQTTILRHLFFTGFPAMFLISPLYYLFSRSFLKVESYSNLSLLHFLPFPLFFALRTTIATYGLKREVFLVLTVQLLIYSILSYRMLMKTAKTEYNKVFKLLTICMVVFAVSVLATFILTTLFDLKIFNLTSALIVFFVAFVSILEVHIIKGIGKPIEALLYKQPKYQSSNLKQQDLDSLGQELNVLMNDEKVFLDADLTAEVLAKQMGINRHQLTEYINQSLGTNFNDLINTYRIEHLKSDLLNQDKKHLSISGLANEAGFGSAATFYRVFKKFTGMTPSEYLDQHS